MNRPITALILFFAALLLSACVEQDPLTGSTTATVLAGPVFTVTERTLGGGTQMIVRGTVKNNGKTVWSPIWLVEGQFYADSTFTYKLGGSTQAFTYSLAKGEATSFELRFNSTTLDLSDYPKFAVRNLRVVQN